MVLKSATATGLDHAIDTIKPYTNSHLRFPNYKKLVCNLTMLVTLVMSNTNSSVRDSLCIEFPYNHRRYTTEKVGYVWLYWLYNQSNQSNQCNQYNQYNQSSFSESNSVDRLNYKLEHLDDPLPTHLDTKQTILFICKDTFSTAKKLFQEFEKRKIQTSYTNILQQISRTRGHEELGSDLTNRVTPDEIAVELSDVLTAPQMQPIFNPGSIVEVNGYIKLHQVKSGRYAKSKSLDRVMMSFIDNSSAINVN